MNKNYVKWIRDRIGKEKIILTFAGGCIFNEKKEILLQRRTDNNGWGFPGGAVELGETPEITAIRESKEETGLDVEVVKLIGVYTDFDVKYPNGDEAQSVCIAYELRIIGGDLIENNGETRELKYFPLDGTPSLFCKQHENLLNDIKKNFVRR